MLQIHRMLLLFLTLLLAGEPVVIASTPRDPARCVPTLVSFKDQALMLDFVVSPLHALHRRYADRLRHEWVMAIGRLRRAAVGSVALRAHPGGSLDRTAKELLVDSEKLVERGKVVKHSSAYEQRFWDDIRAHMREAGLPLIFFEIRLAKLAAAQKAVSSKGRRGSVIWLDRTFYQSALSQYIAALERNDWVAARQVSWGLTFIVVHEAEHARDTGASYLMLGGAVTALIGSMIIFPPLLDLVFHFIAPSRIGDGSALIADGMGITILIGLWTWINQNGEFFFYKDEMRVVRSDVQRMASFGHHVQGSSLLYEIPYFAILMNHMEVSPHAALWKYIVDALNGAVADEPITVWSLILGIPWRQDSAYARAVRSGLQSLPGGALTGAGNRERMIETEVLPQAPIYERNHYGIPSQDEAGARMLMEAS